MTGDKMTTDQGRPKADDYSPLAVGDGASTLLQDIRFIEKVALEKGDHFDRGRISERAIHPRGSGTITAEAQ